jgi:DNA primase
VPQEPDIPDVIVDFEFEDGLLYVVVANLSGSEATAVRVTFDPPFRGLGGTKAMNRLALFRRLEYLAPYKEIRTLLDSSAAYFARQEPAKVTATVTFKDRAGRRHSRKIAHDLTVYADIAYPLPN